MIYVDADACPVRAEVEAVAGRRGVEVRMVSNGGIRPSPAPHVEMVYVSEGADEADKWIAERAGPGDVVVTTDIPLAARAVEGGARVVKPDGSILTEKNVGNALATRDLMADLRAADPFRQGGAKPFTKADRSRFREALDRALRGA
ncbi:YaiI/YqxD family protein [Ovoidimarina sediminis]|uniref:YaiI/YqxD family protein n=1 Tax=Ovoidimarina sediminis TaxID=3079856 RepID=UPI00290BB2C3|nr:YaiI/YqxD family protein [Rhodophyticola sp. MJ-SS7]MDU8944468.1 YaiI/YqxD family protein [Rhodophyticola sp. MJ-SS7]